MRIESGSSCLRGFSIVALALASSACGGGPSSNGGASDGGASDGGASDGGASDGGASDGGAALQFDHLPSYDFGVAVVAGESAPVAFSITNSGTGSSGPLSAAKLRGPFAAQFKIADIACVGKALAPSQTCSVSVEMAPTAVGAASATLTTSAAPGGGAATELTGTAVAQGALVITPSAADFGSEQILDGQKSLTLTVKNTGASSTGELGLELSGSNAGQYAITGGLCMGSLVLGASESCTAVVTFQPIKPGKLPATLVANASPGGSGIANLNGIGLSDAKLQFSTAPTPFGVVDANAPKTETLTVTNAGGVPSGNLAVETKGAAFGVVPGGTCMNGAPLASGASCTVIVQFAPAAIGPVTGSISVSAAPGGSASADLGGTGQKTLTLTAVGATLANRR